MIGEGAVVVVHLGAPREHVFGVILRMSAEGVVVRGLSFSGVEDWLRSVGSADPDAYGVHLATVFYPMHRVEKILLDEPNGPVPSIGGRFRDKTGADLAEHVLAPDAGTAS